MVRESITTGLSLPSTVNEPTGVGCLGLPIEAGISRATSPSMLTVKVCAEMSATPTHRRADVEAQRHAAGEQLHLGMGGPELVRHELHGAVVEPLVMARGLRRRDDADGALGGGAVGDRGGVRDDDRVADAHRGCRAAGWTSATVIPGVGVGAAAEAVAAGTANAIIVTPSMARTWRSARRKCPSLRSSATTDPSRRAANAHDIGSVAGARRPLLQRRATAHGWSATRRCVRRPPASRTPASCCGPSRETAAPRCGRPGRWHGPVVG